MELAEPTKRSLLIELYRDDQFLFPATCFLVKFDSSYFLVSNKHIFTGSHTETREVLGIPNKIVINHHKKAGWENGLKDRKTHFK